jgi:hypothetical protein
MTRVATGSVHDSAPRAAQAPPPSADRPRSSSSAQGSPSSTSSSSSPSLAIGAPLPLRPPTPIAADPRAVAAWCAWLRAMENDAEAALAASLAYESLDGASRDTWLDALDEDRDRLDVPLVAIYAPLLSVERDEARLDRIRDALGSELPPARPLPRPEARALRGVDSSGDRIVVVVLPLYLSFVQVVACRFHPREGFRWATHDAITRDGDAPHAGSETEGVPLERTPMRPVVEELAHAVLAQRRSGKPAPEELKLLLDLFTPQLDDEDEPFEEPTEA